MKKCQLQFQEYLILGHTADQTHVTNVKHNQVDFYKKLIQWQKDSVLSHFLIHEIIWFL